MEQGSIPNLHRGIDGDSQISQNRTGYDEIECNRDKQKTGGTGYLLLTVKANPTLSFRIQEFGMNQTSPSRIRTYDQSVNSRPLYHWATLDHLIVKLRAGIFAHDCVEATDNRSIPGGSDPASWISAFFVKLFSGCTVNNQQTTKVSTTITLL